MSRHTPRYTAALKLWGLCFTLSLFIMGCEEKPPTKTETSATEIEQLTSKPNADDTDAIWAVGAEILEQSTANIKVLNKQTALLLSQPTSESLKTAQQAWAQAASSVEQFYLLSRLGIANPTELQPLIEYQFQLAAWPIQPGYLDSVDEHPYSGIVFDIGSPIEELTLREQHGMMSNSDATLGVYAIEYILFGENNTRDITTLKKADTLSADDKEKGYQNISELPNNRRRALIALQIKILTTDIIQLHKDWRNNNQESLKAKYQQTLQQNRYSHISRASQSVITEQILAISNQETAQINNETLQQNKLALRLHAQLTGFSRVMASLPNSTLGTLVKPAQECAETAMTTHWKDTYDCLHQLSLSLEEPLQN